jgi:membrane protein
MSDADKSPIAALRRWFARVYRERITSFRDSARSFVDDRCFSRPARWPTPMFALVPFTAVVFAMLSAFRCSMSGAPGFRIHLRQFLPGVGARRGRYLHGSGKRAGLPAPASARCSRSYNHMESAGLQIWRVPSSRPQVTRFLMYWTLLTLGSLLMVAALAATSALFSIPALAGIEAQGFSDRILRYLPHAVELLAFTAAYWLIPHRTVGLRYA